MLDPTTAPIGLGGLVLAVERSFALWKGFKYKGITQRELTDALASLREDVSDMLSTAQLQGGLERRDLEKSLVSAVNAEADATREALNGVRQELTAAIRERRR